MSEHGSGIPQTEIYIFVSIYIIASVPLSLFKEYRVLRAPVSHPRHRHAVQQILMSLVEGSLALLRPLIEDTILSGSQHCQLFISYKTVRAFFICYHFKLSLYFHWVL